MIYHDHQPRKKKLVIFQFFQTTNKEEMIELMFFRHCEYRKILNDFMKMNIYVTKQN
jgi:hypothetical protein